MRRKQAVHYEMGLDILGLTIPDINLAPALQQSAQQALQTAEGNLLSTVAANPQVQAAGQQVAQQSSITAAATWITKNKTLAVGLGALAVFGLFRAFSK